MWRFVSKCTRQRNWIKLVTKLHGFLPKWSHEVRKHCCFITGLLCPHRLSSRLCFRCAAELRSESAALLDLFRIRHCGVRGYIAEKSLYHYTVREWGIFMSEEQKGKMNECTAHRRHRDVLEMYEIAKNVRPPQPRGIHSHSIAIKSFPCITKMTVKLIIHIIMVVPPYYPCPVFPLSHYSYENT